MARRAARIVIGITTVGLVAASVPSLAPSARASDVKVQVIHGEAALPAATSELTQDAERAAIDLDLPLEEELLRVRQQKPWDQAVARLQQLDPTAFGSAGRDWDHSPAAWLDLTREPTAAQLRIIKALPFDIRLSTNAPASSAQVEEASSAVHSAVSAIPGIDAVAGGPDAHNTALEVRYSAKSHVDPEAVTKAAQAAARQTLGPVIDQITINASSTSLEAVTGSGTYAGGNDLYDVNDGTFQCTSGLGTTRNGVNGLVTAQHCPNSLTWGDPGRTGIIAYEAAASRTSDYAIDLQFHKSLGSNVASANFQAFGPDENSRRTVHSAANAVVGDTACKFGYGGYRAGISNGYGCSQVTKLAQRVHYTAPYSEDFGGLAQTKTQFFTPGDSGGPIFIADQAMGAVSGNSNDGAVSWFTPQTRWGENLSARIIIG